jgi:hypothetical protein
MVYRIGGMEMQIKQDILMELKYMAEEIAELETEIRRGLEAIEEKKKLESKIENYMASYLRLGGFRYVR